ncbi:MAG: molybdopterin-dependent oxidoreductase [Candidatus Caldarchaeum sp.]
MQAPYKVVRSCCDLCPTHCGVLVKVDDVGRVLKVEGDPDNPFNYGKICAKGNSAVFHLYNPYRVSTPLIRNNPRKGLNEDPEFQQISWDESLDILADRLRRIRSRDPRMVYPVSFDFANLDLYRAWALGYGTLWRPFSSGFYCGNNVHPIHGITVGGIEADPDTELGKYFLLVGCQVGGMANWFAMRAATDIAKRRPGEVKVVAVDPVCSYTAGKAEEWVPIRPGTDAAFLLALVNQLVNVLNLYDTAFLKHRTNAPYLVKNDGLYLKSDGKPLVYDEDMHDFTTFDKARNPSLVGQYFYDGVECRTAFQKLKDHVSGYTPGHASEITTVPAETIERIAKEYGEAANIGGTIEVKGKRLPYRPASCYWYRGLSAHKHSYLSGMAAMLLNVLVGNIDVPGGLLAYRRMKTMSTEEGLLTLVPGRGGGIFPGYPYRKPSLPKSADLFELAPVACYSRPFFIWGITKPEEFRAPHPIDTLMVVRCNPVKTALSRPFMEAIMKKIPYVVSITTEIDETAEFADLVFPDLHYLERMTVGLAFTDNRLDRSGLPRVFFGQKPATFFKHPTPWRNYVNNFQILHEVAERAGFLPEVYKALNFIWGLREPYKLDPNKRYEFEELIDRCLRSNLGNDKGLEWYIRDGLLVEEVSAEEMYRGPFWSGRVQVYYEFMLHAKKDLDEVVREYNIPIDTSDYLPLPEWRPCPAYTPKPGEKYQLFLVNYKTPQQSYGSIFQSVKVLQDLTETHRDDDLLVNTLTASKLGLRDGDTAYVESENGVRFKTRVRVSELVHPEVVGCHGNSGRFSKQLSAQSSGIHWNDFVVFDEEHVDFVSTAVDSCVRVKLVKEVG